jgi:glyoxylase-like metal-dependent hydrolase (beta-lactamase superfamily II)
MAAEVKILVEGQENRPTITLVRDGKITMVVDPGVLESQQTLIDELAKEGLKVHNVNVVCITHSHIDHYRNIGMFPRAKTLEYYGLWDKEAVEDWKEQFSENIQIQRTPGHDYTGITLFVTTKEGVVAICGDVFWKENYPEKPEDDAYASDPEKLQESRNMILKMAHWIIPGHGEIFKAKPAPETELEHAQGAAALRDLSKIVRCKKCKRIMKKEERCLCRLWLCHNCCECQIDCDLCSCSHNKTL